MSGRQRDNEVEQQVILLSAGNGRTPDGDARAHRARSWRGWTGRCWSELLRGQRLLPTLGPRILELAGERRPRGARNRRRGAIEETRRQDALLQLISARTAAALAECRDPLDRAEGVRRSAKRSTAKPGRRLSSDIDLLVAPEHLERAVEVVRGLGYARPTDHVYASGLPLLHFALVHERGRAAAGGAALARPLVRDALRPRAAAGAARRCSTGGPRRWTS